MLSGLLGKYVCSNIVGWNAAIKEESPNDPLVLVFPQVPDSILLVGFQMRRMRQGEVEVDSSFIEVDVHNGRMFLILPIAAKELSS